MANEPALSESANVRIKFFKDFNDTTQTFLVDGLVEGMYDIQIVDVLKLNDNKWVSLPEDDWYEEFDGHEMTLIEEGLYDEFKAEVAEELPDLEVFDENDPFDDYLDEESLRKYINLE